MKEEKDDERVKRKRPSSVHEDRGLGTYTPVTPGSSMEERENTLSPGSFS